jgi:hypothetical protein
MKSPYDAIVEVMRNNLDKQSENQKSNFNNIDKYMIWIVGLSSGAVALIVSNLTSFNKIFPHPLIKLLLFLLFISILCGILFRYLLYKYQIQYQNREMYVYGAFSNMDVMSVDAESIETENDIYKILNALKIDFDVDFMYMAKDYNEAPEAIKIETLNFLKERHKQFSIYTKKSLQLGLDYTIDTLSKAYGISKDKIQKLINEGDLQKLHLYIKLTNIAFWGCCGSFLLVVILLAIYY